MGMGIDNDNDYQFYNKKNQKIRYVKIDTVSE